MPWAQLCIYASLVTAWLRASTTLCVLWHVQDGAQPHTFPECQVRTGPKGLPASQRECRPTPGFTWSSGDCTLRAKVNTTDTEKLSLNDGTTETELGPLTTSCHTQTSVFHLQGGLSPRLSKTGVGNMGNVSQRIKTFSCKRNKVCVPPKKEKNR